MVVGETVELALGVVGDGAWVVPLVVVVGTDGADGVLVVAGTAAGAEVTDVVVTTGAGVDGAIGAGV